MERLIFANWKPRSSKAAKILTCLPRDITPEEAAKITSLEKERDTKKNDKGNPVKWTPNKQAELDRLYKIKNKVDELPPGAISELEDIFDDVYWRRKQILHNKYTEKGLLVEEDSLELLSQIDGVPYWKNTVQYENDYCTGMPDNVTDYVRDVKSNYELKTFRNSTLIDIYKWQIKIYLWLCGLKKGELCYCLVNSPIHRIEADRKSMYYSMGMPSEESKVWIDAVCQLERNHIFDIAAFRKEHPHYDLMNERIIETENGFERLIWTYDIPPQLRVKRYEITLENEDIEHIERRVIMARTWLCERELEVLEKLKIAS